MRVNTDHGYTTQGNLTGQTVKLGFDQNSLVHIMSVLTDLYSDPELAVIREYSTNALDAHREAGNKQPIEVSLPSVLSPFFRVKDYGVGLSVTDIEEIYSKYGASTKRDTDEQTGMLGLGCKSGLTYTNSFNIVSVKDGVKVQAVLSRDDEGAGEIKIVDTRATDAPNGVEIVIPAKHVNDFHRKANEFFRFWEPGTVLVNGQPPKAINGKRVGDNAMLVDSSEVSNNMVVMGNVAYPLDGFRNLSQYTNYSQRVVAWVPMGSVNFTPSREQLMYTKLTEATINKVKAEFDKVLRTAALEYVAAQPDKPSALTAAVQWRKTINQQYTWKKQIVPERFDVRGWHCSDSYGRMSSRRTNYIYTNQFKAVIITGFDKTEVSSNDRKRLRRWMEQTQKGSNVLLVPGPVGDGWLPEPVATWDDVLAVKLPPKSQQAVQPQQYPVWNGRRFEKQVVPPTGKVVYISPADKEHRPGDIQELFPDYMVLEISRNRWDKFRRENPDARTCDELLAEAGKDIVKALTATDVAYLTTDWYTRDGYKKIDPALVNDPEAAEYLRLVRSLGRDYKSDAVTRYHKYIAVCRAAGVERETVDSKNPLAKYPLMGYNTAVDETLEYMNAVYAWRRKGN